MAPFLYGTLVLPMIKKISLHIIFWLFVWTVISFLASGGQKLGEYLLKNVSIMLPLMVVVYLNTEVLFPRLFARKKYVLYGLASFLLLYLALFIGDIIIVEWLELMFPDRPKNDPGRNVYQLPTKFWTFVSGAGLYTLGLLASTIFLAVREHTKKEKELATLQLENAQAKIEQLQAQISPHFLLNSLNNIHALVIQEEEKAGDYIIKLGDLLRYMLYELQQDKTQLGKEVDTLNNYFDLINYRTNRDIKEHCTINITDGDLEIPPLLLMSIIENGIKHSDWETNESAFFELSIQEAGRQLSLEMKNSVTRTQQQAANGIGMQNVKGRLALYYPGRSSFEFERKENHARTKMNIELSCIV